TELQENSQAGMEPGPPRNPSLPASTAALRRPRPWDCRAPARQRDRRLFKRLRLLRNGTSWCSNLPGNPSLSASAGSTGSAPCLGRSSDPVEFHLDQRSRRRPRRPGWNPALPGTRVRQPALHSPETSPLGLSSTSSTAESPAAEVFPANSAMVRAGAPTSQGSESVAHRCYSLGSPPLGLSSASSTAG